MRAIRGNMLRTVLTFMIIAIGITALVGILTAIDTMKASILTNFSRIGVNSFTIRSVRTDPDNEYADVTYKDAASFKDRFKRAPVVSISTNASSIATIKRGARKTNPNVKIMGVDEYYVSLSGYEMSHGRNFSASETQQGNNVAIIGADIKKFLYREKDTIVGSEISIGNLRYTVIGVLESKGSSMMSNDNMVLISELNARRNFNREDGKYVISVAVNHPEELDRTVEDAIGMFRTVRRRRPMDDNDFEVSRSDKLATTVIDELSRITMAATIIGLITLLGAGIGLMNIMLVSVSERTREIGISKAIGARRQNIVVQFLVESVVICQIGGFVGIVLGVMAGTGVALIFRVPFVMPWLWISMGFLFCFIIGLAAGIYPALKASRLDPIEALRYE